MFNNIVICKKMCINMITFVTNGYCQHLLGMGTYWTAYQKTNRNCRRLSRYAILCSFAHPSPPQLPRISLTISLIISGLQTKTNGAGWGCLIQHVCDHTHTIPSYTSSSTVQNKYCVYGFSHFIFILLLSRRFTKTFRRDKWT